MLKTTLIYKNGNKVVITIPKMVQFIDVAAFTDPITFGVEEFVDLTPDNIIKESGFSEVTALEKYKIRFELCGNILGFGIDDRNLFYTEI